MDIVGILCARRKRFLGRPQEDVPGVALAPDIPLAACVHGPHIRSRIQFFQQRSDIHAIGDPDEAGASVRETVSGHCPSSPGSVFQEPVLLPIQARVCRLIEA